MIEALAEKAGNPRLSLQAAQHLAKSRDKDTLTALAVNESVPENIRVVAKLRTG